MTIQELKPILITLLGESSRISWNEATDQAAAAIMELVDAHAIAFADWLGNYDWVPLVDKEKEITTAELLTIFSQSKPAKND